MLFIVLETKNFRYYQLVPTSLFNMMRNFLIIVFSIVFSISAKSQNFNNEWIDYNKTYFKFKVGAFGSDGISPISNGILRIPFATLASNGLGTTDAAHFQLWRDGVEVPIYLSKTSGALSANDYIEFWGEMNNGTLDKKLYRDAEYQLNNKWSLQTDTASYFLTVNTAGTNKRIMDEANNVAGNSLAPTPYFMHTAARYFRAELLNGFSAVVGQNLYSSSYDFGEGFVSRPIKPNENTCGGPRTGQLTQNFEGLQAYTAAGGPSMRFNVNSVGNAANSRSVKVALNGSSVTQYQMDYFYDSKVEEYISTDKLLNDNAVFVFSNESNASCDEFRIASIELTYPRRFNMSGSTSFYIALDPSGNGHYLEFTNFDHGGQLPVIYDISNRKRYLGDTSIAGKVRVVLPPSFVPYKLVLTTQAGNYFKQVTTVQPRTFVDYSQAMNQGDYLIISNPLIYGTGSNNYVEQYRQYRASDKGGKYISQVVDIDQLVDQFAWGVKKHPLSVKNFLRFARSRFSITPRFVFLIGKAVCYNEYRANESNAVAEQLNLVPTFGFPASDNLLSSNNEMAIPATPIGRLSAISPIEVRDYLLKVKQYDSIQNSTNYTLKDKGWMKNVLQITGANDANLGAQLDSYMKEYQRVISDSAFGAKVINYSKSADPGNYAAAVHSFKEAFENGSSLVSYFGHSSATSIDFNLDNPENYDNRYKYPVFIANGCSAGNHFGFEINRLNNKSTVSEKFVLASERGAIGYLSSSHFGIVNYLDMYTQEFYKAFAKTKYNRPVGEGIKEAIANVLASTGNSDYFARVHAEEYAYHGDPAIKINATMLPDYVIEESEIVTLPNKVSVADTSFTIKVRINNIGKVGVDSLDFKLERILPNNQVVTLINKKLAPINLVDSVSIEVPIVPNRDKGLNIFTAAIDYDGKVSEITKINNAYSKSIIIGDDEIRPIYPYNFSIVNNSNIKLTASTVNPLSESREYVLEIDTTELFNSTQKITKKKTSKGGVVAFEPPYNFVDATTYYWRVAATAATEPNWKVASFTFNSGASAGFQQGHFYQNSKSALKNILYDSASKNYSFTSNNHNLFITHGIYPTSGLEDGHFSISVDGSSLIKSACVGASVIINVFDPISFEPVRNTTNPFGAAPVCNVGREYNFEYSYRSASTRKNAMDFIDAIPKGSYVAIRLVLDNPYNSWASDWAADTSLYGSNNSLYHRLKKHGFAQIDSFYFPRNWALIFKKEDTTFAPVYKLSDGLYDRLTMSQNCVTPSIVGSVTSPTFGPSKGWKTVTWSGSKMPKSNVVPTVNVIGIGKDNNEIILFTLDSTRVNMDLSSVDPLRFPFIKLQLKSLDSAAVAPYQLTNWKIEYEAAPEGGLAPNLFVNIPDTIGGTSAYNNTILPIQVAYKNVSAVAFDSLTVKITLTDSANNIIELPRFKTRSLPAGDTLHINTSISTPGFHGLYNVFVQVNPNPGQYEQESFNNTLYKYVYINQQTLLPVTLTKFEAMQQGDDVKTSWQTEGELNVRNYTVQHSINGLAFAQVGNVNAIGASSYQFIHKNAPIGKNYYRLLITDKDGSVKLSPVKIVNIAKESSVQFYPNPVKDKLTIVLNSSSANTTTITLLSSAGQVLLKKQIKTSYIIDMAGYASGTYLLRIDDGLKTTTHKVQKQ